MRVAAARAASRRGSSTMIFLPRAHGSAASTSGTRVDLPAPGGATSTAALRPASAAVSAGSAASMGKTWSNSIMYALPGRTARLALFPFEQAEIDRLAEQEIAVRRGMDSVAAVVGHVDDLGVARVAYQLVEVEHGVEAGLLADEIVDLVADLALGVAPAGIRDARHGGVAGNDRHSDDLDALLLHPGHDVLDAGDDLLGGRLA